MKYAEEVKGYEKCHHKHSSYPFYFYQANAYFKEILVLENAFLKTREGIFCLIHNYIHPSTHHLITSLLITSNE